MSAVSPAALADPEAAAPTQEEEIPRVSCFFRYYGIIVRIWAFVTVLALGVSTWWLMTRRDDYPYTSWYTMSTVIVTGLVELIWVINFCAVCKDDGGTCCTFWRLCVWIDNWRKTIIYVLLAVPEFVIDKSPALVPFIAGSIIVLLGILYLFKTCESCSCCQDKRRSESAASTKQEKSKASDKRSTASKSLPGKVIKDSEKGESLELIKSTGSQRQ